MHAKPESLSYLSSVPGEVADYINRLLSKKPGDRPGSWRSVINKMNKLLALRKKNSKTNSSGSSIRVVSSSERRNRALLRLKKRKRKESRVLRNYCFALVGFFILFFIADFTLQQTGSGGAFEAIKLFVDNFREK